MGSREKGQRDSKDVRLHQGNKIVGHQKPVDGEGYAESIRKIFPKKYHKAIFAEAEETGLDDEGRTSDANCYS